MFSQRTSQSHFTTRSSSSINPNDRRAAETRSQGSVIPNGAIFFPLNPLDTSRPCRTSSAKIVTRVGNLSDADTSRVEPSEFLRCSIKRVFVPTTALGVSYVSGASINDFGDVIAKFFPISRIVPATAVFTDHESTRRSLRFHSRPYSSAMAVTPRYVQRNESRFLARLIACARVA